MFDLMFIHVHSNVSQKKVKRKKVLLVAKDEKYSFHVIDILFSTKNDYVLQNARWGMISKILYIHQKAGVEQKM